MPTVLFVTWDGGGNVNPILGLGPRLAAQGVTPVGFGPPSLAPRFAAAGVAYVSREAADPWDVAAMAADVRAECRRAAASLAVVDYMLPGALVGAEAAEVPAVALVHTLYGALLGDGDFPGPMAMAATVEALDAAAWAPGAAPVAGLADLLDRCARVLVACPASLDACPEHGAANVRHVGPVLEAGREQPHNARAVAQRGVGLAVDPAAGSEAVRDEVRQVLGEPRYREAAATLASSIARPGEPSPAEAEILAVVR